jgi:hypothetical protein
LKKVKLQYTRTVACETIIKDLYRKIGTTKLQ